MSENLYGFLYSNIFQIVRMHSVLTRANALVAYTMSVLASLTFLCFVSTFFNEYQVYDMNLLKALVCISEHNPNISNIFLTTQ